MGRLHLVESACADTPAPHYFDQVSRVARADPRLSDRGYRILATLEGYCWGEARDTWVTNKTIGRESGGASADTVRRALRELEQLGYIRIEPDSTKMRGQRIILLYVLRQPDARG